jgi:hypothetical protein
MASCVRRCSRIFLSASSICVSYLFEYSIDVSIWDTILTSSLQHLAISKQVWHVKKRHHLSASSAQVYFEDQQTRLDETSVSIFSHIVLSSSWLNSENDITLSCLAVTDRRGGSRWRFVVTISNILYLWAYGWQGYIK